MTPRSKVVADPGLAGVVGSARTRGWAGFVVRWDLPHTDCVVIIVGRVMATRNISLRMSEEKIERVDRLAKALGRSRAWIINEATDRYLAYESWFIEQVEQGLAEAEAGKTIPHDEVMAGLRKRIAKAGK